MPIAIFPTRSEDLDPILSREKRRLLGRAFVLHYVTSTINSYIIFGVEGMAYLEHAKKAKIWAAPCKPMSLTRI